MCILYRYPQRFMITFFFWKSVLQLPKSSRMPRILDARLENYKTDLTCPDFVSLWLDLEFDLTSNYNTWLYLWFLGHANFCFHVYTQNSFGVIMTWLVLELDLTLTWLDLWFSKLKYMTWYGYMNMENLTTNSHFTSIPPHNDYE